MTGTLQFDAEAARHLEAVYTTPDVVEQRRAMLDALAPRPRERVIDIGVGPGLLAAEIAAALGPEGVVCGIDISDSMLALAAARDHAETYSARTTGIVAAFVVGRDGLGAEEVEAWAAEAAGQRSCCRPGRV